MQLYTRRYGGGDATVGTDQALVGHPVPSECTLNYFRAEVHMLPGATIDVQDIVMYNCEAWLVPNDNLSDLATLQTMWDSYIPKEDDDTSFATPGSDTESFSKPGAIDTQALFGINDFNAPERLFKREKMLSMASVPIGFKTGTPDTFYPSDVFNINVRKKYRAMSPSALMVGIGSPDWPATGNDDVFGTIVSSRHGGIWTVKYIEEMLDKAVIDMMNATELGAETPWEDILAEIVNILEEVNVLSGVGAFTEVTWTGFCKSIAGIEVPGRLRHSSLGPDMEG